MNLNPVNWKAWGVLISGTLRAFRRSKSMVAKKPKPLTKRTVGKVARRLQNLYKQYTKNTIPLKELKAMLLYLIDNYAAVIYDCDILKVQTDDIICGGNLGPAVIIFKIEKALQESNRYSYFRNASLKVKDLRGKRFNHQHVFHEGNGQLCRGSAKYVLQKRFQQGCLDDFFDVIQQVLRT